MGSMGRFWPRANERRLLGSTASINMIRGASGKYHNIQQHQIHNAWVGFLTPDALIQLLRSNYQNLVW